MNEVLWWNSEKVFAFIPSRGHYSVFNASDLQESRLRVKGYTIFKHHQSPAGIHLPTDYEIDRQNQRFVALDASSSYAPATLWNDFEQQRQNKRRDWEKSFEKAQKEGHVAAFTLVLAEMYQVDQETPAFDIASLDEALECFFGRKMLDGSPYDSDVKEIESGVTWTLVIKLRDLTCELLTSLEQANYNVNEADSEGYTPLARARLCGQKLAKTAEVFDKTRRMRIKVAGIAIWDRIMRHVMTPSDITCLQTADPLPKFRLVSEDKIEYAYQRGILQLCSSNKNTAVIHRGGNYPDVVAIDGWGDRGKLSWELPYLSGTGWWKEAFRVAEDLGYEFPPHRFDKDVAGRWFATHAEVKLILFFISRHVFLPSEKREGHKLAALAKAQPSARLTSAKIFVCNDAICESCQKFVAFINKTLDLSIELVANPPKGTSNPSDTSAPSGASAPIRALGPTGGTSTPSRPAVQLVRFTPSGPSATPGQSGTPGTSGPSASIGNSARKRRQTIAVLNPTSRVSSPEQEVVVPNKRRRAESESDPDYTSS